MFRFFTVLLMTLAFVSSAVAQDRAQVMKYMPATIENNSNALFKIGILRPADPLAVDEYLRIHHCGLYEQYGSDDVAWARLRDAQARELGLISPSFSENLEVEGSILIGNYDLATGRFPIQVKDAFNNTGIVSLNESNGGSYSNCERRGGKSFVPRAHPLRLSARLSKPLDMDEFSVSPAMAEDMIKIINTRKADDTKQRSVLVVMRLHLKGPDPLSGSTEPSTITVAADLDEIQIYEGPERKLLLYSQKFIDPKAPKSGSR